VQRIQRTSQPVRTLWVNSKRTALFRLLNSA